MSYVASLLSDPRYLACAVPVILLMLILGSVVVVQFTLLDIHLSSADLPKRALDGLTTYEILGHPLKLNPGHVAEFFLGVWLLSSIAFVGLANLPTYGLQRWTRRLSEHPHAMRLLSSLWMQESELGDYYLLVNFGLRSGRRRAARRRRHARYGERLRRLFRVGYRLCCVVGQFIRYVKQLRSSFRARNVCRFFDIKSRSKLDVFAIGLRHEFPAKGIYTL